MAKLPANAATTPAQMSQPQAPVAAPQAPMQQQPSSQPIAQNPVQTQVAVVQQQQPAPIAIITKADRPANLARYDANKGLALLSQFIQPPRVKIVQKTAAQNLRSKFQDGTLIVMPGEIKLADMADREEGYAIPFIPLYFFPEWYALNPYACKGVLPYVQDRSTDPTSYLVQKCRARTENDPCPGMPHDGKGNGLFLSYKQALNFIVLMAPINQPDYKREPTVLSFWSGEFTSGQKFAGLLRARETVIFGNRFEMYSKYRPGTGKGDWFGINVQNPESVAPFVSDDDTLNALEVLHNQFKEAHLGGELQGGDVDETTDPNGAPTESNQY